MPHVGAQVETNGVESDGLRVVTCGSTHIQLLPNSTI